LVKLINVEYRGMALSRRQLEENIRVICGEQIVRLDIVQQVDRQVTSDNLPLSPRGAWLVDERGAGGRGEGGEGID
jgi:hypothetical protein